MSNYFPKFQIYKHKKPPLSSRIEAVLKSIIHEKTLFRESLFLILAASAFAFTGLWTFALRAAWRFLRLTHLLPLGVLLLGQDFLYLLFLGRSGLLHIHHGALVHARTTSRPHASTAHWRTTTATVHSGTASAHFRTFALRGTLHALAGIHGREPLFLLFQVQLINLLILLVGQLQLLLHAVRCPFGRFLRRGYFSLRLFLSGRSRLLFRLQRYKAITQ